MISQPHRKSWSALLALLALVLLGAGCKDFFTDAQLTAITISPSAPTVAIGATVNLSAQGSYNGSSKDITSSVTWTSSNTAVATVTNKGVVTGVSNGSSTIQAAASGITASVTVAVGNAVVLQTITVTPATATIAAGLTQQYAATGNYSDGTTQNITSSVTWATGNTAVATIDTAGLATVASGATTGQNTTVTATSGTVSNSTAVLTVQ